MDIEKFREYCLSLGEVTEKMPFGKFARRYDSILAFYVLGHMFCFIDIDDFTWANLRLTPLEIDELRANYMSVGNPINQSLRYWIRTDFGGDIPDRLIYDLTAKAYDTVRNKYLPKTKNKKSC